MDVLANPFAASSLPAGCAAGLSIDAGVEGWATFHAGPGSHIDIPEIPKNPEGGHFDFLSSRHSSQFVHMYRLAGGSVNGTGGGNAVNGAGGASGGGGNGGDDDDDDSDVDVLLKAKKGLDLLAKGSGQTARAKQMLWNVFPALKSHVEELEANLAQTILEKKKLEGELKDVKDKSVSRHSFNEKVREIIRLNERTFELEQEIKSLKKMIDPLLSNSSHARNLVQEQSQLVDQADDSYENAAQSLRSALEMIAPVLGEGSPIARRIQDAIDVIEGARRLFASMREMGAEAARHLEPSASQAKYLPPRFDSAAPIAEEKLDEQTGAGLPLDRSRFLELGDDAAASIPGISSKVIGSSLSSLRAAFEDIKGIKIHEVYDAFVRSMRTLYEHGEIHGASLAADRAIATTLHPESKLSDIRGFFFEIVRLAQLIEGGREIDSIAIMVPSIYYHGFRLNYESYELRFIEMHKSSAEIDARAGKSFIEIKTISLGNSVGRYIKLLLAAASEGNVPNLDVRTIREQGEHAFRSFKKALNIVNQLIKYKYMIGSKGEHSLEYHNTAWNPAPSDVIKAMHDFFGEGNFRYIWYYDLLSPESHEIIPTGVESPGLPGDRESEVKAPSEAPMKDIEATTPPDSAEDEEEVGEDAVELVVEIDEDIAEEESYYEDHELEGVADDVSDIDAEAPASDEGAEISADGFEAAGSGVVFKEYEEASQRIYSNSSFLQLIGYRMEGVAQFILGLVRDGQWNALRDLPKEELPHRLLPLWEQWSDEQDEESHQIAAANAPWDAIDDKAAQASFDNFLQRQDPRRKMSMDWDHRVTKTIFNEHVSGALAEMQDTDAVKDEPELSEQIGRFIEYLRDRYQTRSYFKITEDGPELLEICRRFVWLCRDRRTNGD